MFYKRKCVHECEPPAGRGGGKSSAATRGQPGRSKNPAPKNTGFQKSSRTEAFSIFYTHSQAPGPAGLVAASPARCSSPQQPRQGTGLGPHGAGPGGLRPSALRLGGPGGPRPPAGRQPAPKPQNPKTPKPQNPSSSDVMPMDPWAQRGSPYRA
jgi:hypothetical protein